MRRLILAASMVALAVSPLSAQDGDMPASSASPSSSKPFQLEAHGGVGWYGLGPVAGVRFGIPLLKDGLVGSLDDALYLSVGADLYYVARYCVRDGCQDYGLGLGFPVVAHWEIELSESLSVFAELGVNVYLTPSQLEGRPSSFGAAPWIAVAFGGTWRLSDSFGFILRVGNPAVTFGGQLEL